MFMRFFLAAKICLFLTAMVQAVEFNPIFSSHMVLQRNVPVRIYGEGKDGEKLKVSFKGQSVEAVVKKGKWEVFLKPMTSDAEGKSLILQSGDTQHELKDVLVGDVWVLGGQSNMFNPFKSYPELVGVPKLAHHPLIRLVGIDPEISATPEPVDHFKFLVQTPWKRAVYQDDNQTAKLLDHFSPAGYYFGTRLQKHLNIPVGLMMACLGGTRAECWTPKDALEKDPKLHFYFEQDKKIKPKQKRPHRQHTTWLYNGVIHPITKFTIKGVLWYQGESNAKTYPEPYRVLFPQMIDAWRKAWGQGNFPFIFAQLASYGKASWDKTGTTWAVLRESQAYGLSRPNTGMINLMDVGEFEDIHPSAKEDVGHRFFMKAREVAYGEKIVSSGPVYESKKVEGSSIVLQFKNVGKGLEFRRVSMPVNATSNNKNKNDSVKMLSSKEGELDGFVICGADEQFVEAQAKIISKNQVRVFSDPIKEPKHVRYGWKNFTLANMYNKEGFPTEPFRTDSFNPNDALDF